jgi:hypothetical protein
MMPFIDLYFVAMCIYVHIILGGTREIFIK